MGTFTEVIGVGNSTRERFEPVEALVDTGCDLYDAAEFIA